MQPPGGVRIHIAGIDLIRDDDGTFRVLEDNLRTPSGVSYVLENRLISKRVFPARLEEARIQRVDHYPAPPRRDACAASRPAEPGDASRASSSRRGRYNSAYFEHTFLARTMGIELVVGRRPVRRAATRCSCGPRAGRARVHVIYRRIDEAYLDPEVFRPDSLLGVRGLFARLQGRQGRDRQRASATASPTTRPCTRSCRT